VILKKLDRQLEIVIRGEPFVAYRAWLAEMDVLLLKSYLVAYVWPPKVRTEAFCKGDDTPVWPGESIGNAPQSCDHDPTVLPGEYCSCGIYAHKTKQDTQRWMKGRDNRFVYGEVFLWGRVIECDWGYRAQYAYPKSVYIDSRLASLVAKRYELPAAA
jgi:hypothetical protein